MLKLASLLLSLSTLHGFPYAVMLPNAAKRFDFVKQQLSIGSGTHRFASATNDVNEIKHDIEELRQEALRRLDALHHKVEELASFTSTETFSSVHEKDLSHGKTNKQSQQAPAAQTTATAAISPESTSIPPSSVASTGRDSDISEPKSNTLEQDRPRKLTGESNRGSLHRTNDLNLLDGTHWKIMLNVGRETGTWMPKTWGASGERLLLNMEVEFTPNQLYEREDFLNGMAGAKELYVSELTTAPSMSEGSRKVPVKAVGGWRIARGEGPVETDLLRFYVELEEEVRHAGCDVFCPAGRVYFTCGYFPLTHRDSKMPSLKDVLREEHDAILARYDELSKEMNEDNNLISWDRMKRSKELLDLRVKAGKVVRQIEEAKVREPEKASLRLSKKRDVGLTKEGGLCCKVIKGLSMEYHILGKFGVACIEHRDHDLRP